MVIFTDRVMMFRDSGLDDTIIKVLNVLTKPNYCVTFLVEKIIVVVLEIYLNIHTYYICYIHNVRIYICIIYFIVFYKYLLIILLWRISIKRLVVYAISVHLRVGACYPTIGQTNLIIIWKYYFLVKITQTDFLNILCIIYIFYGDVYRIAVKSVYLLLIFTFFC